jgi:hypothetical protein
VQDARPETVAENGRTRGGSALAAVMVPFLARELAGKK